MARRAPSKPGSAAPAAAPATAPALSPAEPGRRKGARRTTPSPETLAGLGPERLIGLILGETARNPAFKKIVSAALAALQGPDAVAAIVDRRLAALEGARGFIDWQKRRAFTADLNATVSVIVNELRPLDPGAALDRLLRFLSGAETVLRRVDDSLGITQGVYERAAEAAVEIAGSLPAPDAARFALALVPRIGAEPDGVFGVLLTDLIPRLAEEAWAELDAALAGAEPPDAADRQPAWQRGYRRGRLIRIRQDLADRRGDVDAFIALEQQAMPGRPDPVAVAERLLGAGRAAEALDWLRRPRETGRPATRADLIAGAPAPEVPDRARAVAEIRALEALGRRDEAQALRWDRFALTLDRDMLRDYLAKLPDFEDDPALERAFAQAAAHPQPYRALTFLINWPHLDGAARLVRARRATWEGERYEVLVPAAEALEEAHPEEAALLYRRLIDDILARGRAQAYGHAARYLAHLDALARRLAPGSLEPEQAAYREALRRAHGRKHGFWSLVAGV
ncbi:DUF6880 family protein [Methylobacterium soli]|uniref:Uncharacterized protein n=1 Tax=Methylobacterium soli TaxID=553447 RepID=A0A6L3SPF7_9HYPH|nr:DUF6880 family protein [Methylobacterium soli]KAB1071558.1 hypothetical protein F6X53_29000 [Methylobacterium soli]GJE43467.1 hypothetical protein AEGHOMDF_2646 [Methylobacterium soli]